LIQINKSEGLRQGEFVKEIEEEELEDKFRGKED
jgi:hypothetical protein